MLLRTSFIAPIAIAYAATRAADNLVSAAVSQLDEWVIPIVNFFGRKAAPLWVEIPAPAPLHWNISVLIYGAVLVMLAAVWLVALWFYPETDPSDATH